MQAEDFIRKMRGVTLLIVGDVMLDVYEHAEIKESQERFSPVYSVKERTYYLGGAANVAYIAAALGASVRLVGSIGTDDSGHVVCDLLRSNDYIIPCLVAERGRPTTTKTRVLVAGSPCLRRDFEATTTLSVKSARLMDRGMAKGDAVLLSDYNKGVLRTPGVIKAAMAMAPLRVLDPKISWAPFDGVQYATPNAREANSGGLTAALTELPDASIIETLGPYGAKIHRHISNETYHTSFVPTIVASEVDAVGAGDAFAAAFTLAKAAGADDVQAVVVGQGVARWWVLHERGDMLSIAEIENQVAIVEDQQL